MFETLARTGENVAGILFYTEKKGEKHTCQLPVTGFKPTEMHGSWVFHSMGGLTGPHPSPLLWNFVWNLPNYEEVCDSKVTSTVQAIGRKKDGNEETLEQVFIGMEKKEEKRKKEKTCCQV